MSDPSDTAPLAGMVVLDVTRLLPGAVLARQLIDLGARVIKVEEPAGGDPLRHAPPLVKGEVSAVFAALLRGAESICLDLDREHDSATLRRLSRHADVLVESFRPGTMAAWGLSAEHLQACNPGLICCSLSAYGQRPAKTDAGRVTVAHDLNLVAESGMLALLPGQGVPQVQLADVTTGLLAASAVLAALLQRQRTGCGAVIDQPLLSGVLPALTWAWADTTAGGQGQSLLPTVLGGRCPAYRLYRCADGTSIAVATIEPKLWTRLVQVLELPAHAGAGLDSSEHGDAAAAALAEVFGRRPQHHWLDLAAQHDLPISPVEQVPPSHRGGRLRCSGLLEHTPLPGGGSFETPGPFLPSMGATPQRPAPRLGEQTEAILEEMGLGG